MKRVLLLTLVLMLAACGSPQVDPLPTSTAAVPAPTEVLSPPAETAAPAPTAVPDNILDARNTYAVIAAVNGHVLMIEGWLEAEVSLNERQAILFPQLEIGLEALNEVLASYQPYPDLEEAWALAEVLSDELMALSLGWASGEAAGEEFQPKFSEMAARSSDLMLRAAEIMESLGEASSDEDPMETVYGLLSDPVTATQPVVEGEALPTSLNEEILPVQVVPFIYPFAGTDVFIVIGLVENTGGQPQEAVTVSVRFYNFLDEHLGTSTGQILVETLEPGKTAPFMATTVTEGEEAALQDWTRYEVEVVSRAGEESYQPFEEFVASSEMAGNGRYQITGEATNTGGQTIRAEAVRVSVAAFDAGGNLVGVGEGYLTGEGELAPGDTAAFQAVIEAVSAEPAAFFFFAEVIE